MISTEDEFSKQFEHYVHALHLDDWIIKLAFVPPIEDRWAEVTTPTGGGRSEVSVGTDLLEQPWHVQKAIMLHELMHMMAHDLLDFVRRTVSVLDIPMSQKILIESGLTQQNETFVDQLARVLVEAL